MLLTSMLLLLLLTSLVASVRCACLVVDAESGESVVMCEPVFYVSDLLAVDSTLLIDCKNTKMHVDLFNFQPTAMANLTLINCPNSKSLESLVSKLTFVSSSLKLINTSMEVASLPFSLTFLSVLHGGVGHLDLSDLCAVREVDVSHNVLGAMDKLKWCSSTLNLSHLDVSFNTLTTLPNHMFDTNLISLQELRVSHNFVDVIHSDAFVNLPNLRLLDLSHNKLATLPSSLFKTNTRLEELRVEHNFIAFVDPNTFLSFSLVSLNMSSNSISELSFLRGLSKLQKLDLSSNSIVHLEPLSSTLTSLTELRLDANQINHVASDVFRSLKSLLSLSLSNNGLVDVAADVGLTPRLEHLDLSFNGLKAMPTSVGRLRHLRSLDLSSNGLSKESLQDSFNELRVLILLNLSHNRLSDIDGLLTKQSQLRDLDVSHNVMHWFDYGSLPPSVQKLSLAHNQLSKLDHYYCDQQVYQLRHLDVRHNNVVAIDRCSLVASLRRVDLRHNNVEAIEKNAFTDLINVKKVDLRHNRLRTLQPAALIVHDDQVQPDNLVLKSDGRPSPFWLSWNPFECDCNLEWLENHGHRRVADFKRIRCTPRPLGGLQRIAKDAEEEKGTSSQGSPSEGSSALALSEARLLCVYDSYCFTLCECCDFFACDCRMQCPEQCKCYHDATWTSNIIDCSVSNHTRVPSFIPMKASVVYLDGNKLESFNDTDVFIGRVNLIELYLNDSSIETIGDHVFDALVHLQVLHLDHNRLQALSTAVLANLGDLRRLYLNDNRLSYLAFDIFVALTSLETLDLSRNRLAQISSSALMANKRLRVLRLENNVFRNCGCEVAREVRQRHPQLDLDIECDQSMLDNNIDKCLSTQAVLQKEEKREMWWLWLSLEEHKTIIVAILVPVICVILATITFVCIVLTVGRHRRVVADCDDHVVNERLVCNTKAGIAISFAEEDTQLVHRELLPLIKTTTTTLLTTNNFNLLTCPMVLVASAAFVASPEWQLLKRRLQSDPKAMHNLTVIILWMPDLNTMDVELLALLRSQPFVKYSEDPSWQRLLLMQLQSAMSKSKKKKEDEMSVATSGCSTNVYSMVDTSLSDAFNDDHVYNAILEEDKTRKMVDNESLTQFRR